MVTDKTGFFKKMKYMIVLACYHLVLIFFELYFKISKKKYKGRRLKDNIFNFYIGFPGAGKSYWQNFDLFRVSKARPDREIISFRYDLNLPNCKRIDTIEQLKKLRHCELSFEEIGVLFPATLHKAKDIELAKFLLDFFAQHRKRDINIYANTQGEDEADKKIRTVCKRVFYCVNMKDYVDATKRPGRCTVLIKRLYKYDKTKIDFSEMLGYRIKLVTINDPIFKIYDTEKEQIFHQEYKKFYR